MLPSSNNNRKNSNYSRYYDVDMKPRVVKVWIVKFHVR